MEDVTVVTVPADEDLPVVHQLGKTVVGGVAAFAAGKLADRIYDGAVRAWRSRKNS